MVIELHCYIVSHDAYHASILSNAKLTEYGKYPLENYGAWKWAVSYVVVPVPTVLIREMAEVSGRSSWQCAKYQTPSSRIGGHQGEILPISVIAVSADVISSADIVFLGGTDTVLNHREQVRLLFRSSFRTGVTGLKYCDD